MRRSMSASTARMRDITRNWIGPAEPTPPTCCFRFSALQLSFCLWHWRSLGMRWLKHPHSQFAGRDAGGLWADAAVAAITAELVAFSRCARERCHPAACWARWFPADCARGFNPIGRECGGFCSAAHRFVHDHAIFLFRRACVGQWDRRAAGRGGNSLAFCKRRKRSWDVLARGTEHARKSPACGGDGAFRAANR